VGHPLLADVTYGGLERLALKRQALHATRLGFVHPASGEAMTFEALLPPDLQQAWMQVNSQA
jgi:23S rRNA pseudouridine1911/1915/1917 synthase